MDDIMHQHLMKDTETIRICEHTSSTLLATFHTVSVLLHVCFMSQKAIMASLLLLILSVTLLTVYLSALCPCLLPHQHLCFLYFFCILSKAFCIFFPIPLQLVYFAFPHTVVMKTNLLLIELFHLKNKGMIWFSTFLMFFFFNRTTSCIDRK